uniref:Secreted protein n=1 Tax=Haemonchus contortus TaxID=6289 RepID=A0A7I4XWW3_HAECO|nr:unnamed protein product [Haemonchus contortus]
MDLWLTIAFLLGVLGYISAIIACGKSDKDMERVQKRSHRQSQQQQHHSPRRQKSKIEKEPKSQCQSQVQNQGQNQTQTQTGNDSAYEACQDMTPEELRRIAAQA